MGQTLVWVQSLWQGLHYMVAWISGGWLQTIYTSYWPFCSDMRFWCIVNIGLLLFPGSEHVLNQAHPPQECRDLMYLILPVQNLTALLGRINCFDLFLQHGAITISSMHHPTLFFRIFLEPSQLSFGECNKTGTSWYKVFSQLAFWAMLRGTVQRRAAS